MRRRCRGHRGRPWRPRGIGIVDPGARVEGDLLGDEADLESAAAAARAYHPDPDGPFVLQMEQHRCVDAKTGEPIGSMIDNSARIEPEATEPSQGRWGPSPRAATRWTRSSESRGTT